MELIFMDWSMELIEEFIAFGLYRRPPNLVKYFVEEGGSKSGSGDQSISQYLQWDLQFLRFYERDVEEETKDRVYWGWHIISKWGIRARHQDGSHNGKDHVDVGFTDVSQGHILH